MAATTTITAVGGLLPTDLLARVAAGDGKLPGSAPTDYGLAPGERLNDHITRSWNRLQGLWANFGDQLAQLPDSDRTATSLTRERWLLPLLDELGFAGLPVAKSQVLDGKEYPISHQWDGQVPVHLPGARIAVDRRTAGVPGAATTSPHGLLQEYLNRSDDQLWGIVSNGLVLRILRDNASLTRQAYVEFDLEAMFAGEAFADFVTLWLTCHRTRFTADQPEKCYLEQWSQEAVTSGTRALDKLREGVEAAIVGLGTGFVAHPGNGTLREALRDGSLSTVDYQRQLLRTVYRLLFLLVAEQRDLLLDPDADATAKDRYRRFYGIERLRTLSLARRGSTHDDLWESLGIVTDALHRDGAPALGLAPLGSFLWSPHATSDLADSRLQNRHLLEAIRSLTLVRDAESKVHRTVDYRNLGAEELGSIYESLLELHAEVDPDARTFRLDTAAGNERKTTGSYYTPTSLITELLDSALDPVLDEAAQASDPAAAILDLSVADLAAGSGHFLIAAANRIAQRLASVRAGGIEPAPDEVRHALRDVIGSCIYGVDVNPMAVELCKVSLWLEAMEPGKPLSFLDHRIVCGNSLLGTTPRLLADGIPDDAYKPLLGDDTKTVTALKNQNKRERKGQQQLGLAGGSIAELARPAAIAIAAIDAVEDDTLAGMNEKRRLLDELTASSDAAKAKLAADAWCAAFVCIKAPGEPVITTDTVRRIADDPLQVDPAVLDRVRQIAGEYGFAHPHLQFPTVYETDKESVVTTGQSKGWTGGFSVCLGNPPWDQLIFQEREFFANRDPEIAAVTRATTRAKLIGQLQSMHPQLHEEFIATKRRSKGEQHLLRSSGRYPTTGLGRHLTTSGLFAERSTEAIAKRGAVGLVLPTEIATGDTTKLFFQRQVQSECLVSVFDFENRNGLFPGVHRSYRFCLITMNGFDRRSGEATFVFDAVTTAELRDADRSFALSSEEFALLNPTTLTCPTFRSSREAAIVKAIYSSCGGVFGPSNVSHSDGGWGLATRPGLYNMGLHSAEFRTQNELSEQQAAKFIPLFEGKMIHQFDHRWSSVDSDVPIDRQSATALAEPRYWVDSRDVRERANKTRWFICFRDITHANNERTAIAAALPLVGIGHNLPILDCVDRISAVALLNSFVVDFVVRRKVAGSHLTISALEQLPAPDPDSLHIEVGWLSGSAFSFIAPRVLELCYTAWDLVAFGADGGTDHAPFVWNDDRRAVLRAELDALFFGIAGLLRDDVIYILDTFPIVKRRDEERHGEYRTKRLILECFDRMAEAKASGDPYETILDPPPADLSLCHPESTRPDWADLYLEL